MGKSILDISMVRLERQGDSFVMITGQKQSAVRPGINALLAAISELQKNPQDKNKIREGLLYLDNSAGIDLRKQIRTILQKAVDNKDMTVTDL